MSSTPPTGAAPQAPPPSRHQMAVMIWIAVFPTLTVLNLVLGGLMADLHVVLRTLVLATIAVPIVIYGIMPLLQRARGALLRRMRPAG